MTVDNISIEIAEDDLQADINNLYENEMPNGFFKVLRGIQQVIHVKIIWNKGIVDIKRNAETVANINSKKSNWCIGKNGVNNSDKGYFW
jgi:hypothetical protein